MAQVALFHSVLGLRPVEHAAAERLRAAGHDVILPDLYAGASANGYEDAFALLDRVGWTAVMARADDAVRDLADGAVLAGISMGAGVLGELLPGRPDTAGVLLLHATTAIPRRLRPGLPIEVHISDRDRFESAEDVAAWRDTALDAGADVEVHTYSVPGHFFTDPDLLEYDADAADLTWRRSLEFLRVLRGG